MTQSWAPVMTLTLGHFDIHPPSQPATLTASPLIEPMLMTRDGFS